MGLISQVSNPPERPVLIYDGECRFCRRWVARWQRLVGDRVHALASQDRDRLERFPELTHDGLDTAVHLIEPDGRVTRGAEAVFRSLTAVWRGPLWAYERVPGCAAICEAVYRFIARRRTCHSCGPRGQPPI